MYPRCSYMLSKTYHNISWGTCRGYIFICLGCRICNPTLCSPRYHQMYPRHVPQDIVFMFPTTCTHVPHDMYPKTSKIDGPHDMYPKTSKIDVPHDMYPCSPRHVPQDIKNWCSPRHVPMFPTTCTHDIIQCTPRCRILVPTICTHDILQCTQDVGFGTHDMYPRYLTMYPRCSF